MLYYVLILSTVFATNAHVHSKVKLNCLIASTKGRCRRRLPEWSEVLDKSDACLASLGFPESRIKLRDMNLKLRLLNAELRDAESAFRSRATKSWKTAEAVECLESADISSFIDSTIAQLRISALTATQMSLSDFITRLLSRATHAAKHLKSFLVRSDVTKKCRNSVWLLDYCCLADKMLYTLESLSAPLKQASDDAMGSYLKDIETVPNAPAVLKLGISHLLKHHLDMLEVDTALLRLFMYESPNLQSIISLTFRTESLSVIVGYLLISTAKIRDPRVQQVWEAIKSSHTTVRAMKAKAIECRRVTFADCNAWRKKQLKQVHLIFALDALV